MPDKTQLPSTRFREMLKLYRAAHSLSYRQMAALTGLDHSAIWRFEEGRQIQEHVFSRLISWIMEAHEPSKFKAVEK